MPTKAEIQALVSKLNALTNIRAKGVLEEMRALHQEYAEVLRDNPDYVLAGTLLTSVIEALEQARRDLANAPRQQQQQP